MRSTLRATSVNPGQTNSFCMRAAPIQSKMGNRTSGHASVQDPALRRPSSESFSVELPLQLELVWFQGRQARATVWREYLFQGKNKPLVAASLPCLPVCWLQSACTLRKQVACSNLPAPVVVSLKQSTRSKLNKMPATAAASLSCSKVATAICLRQAENSKFLSRALPAESFNRLLRRELLQQSVCSEALALNNCLRQIACSSPPATSCLLLTGCYGKTAAGRLLQAERPAGRLCHCAQTSADRLLAVSGRPLQTDSGRQHAASRLLRAWFSRKSVAGRALQADCQVDGTAWRQTRSFRCNCLQRLVQEWLQQQVGSRSSNGLRGPLWHYGCLGSLPARACRHCTAGTRRASETGLLAFGLTMFSLTMFSNPTSPMWG